MIKPVSCFIVECDVCMDPICDDYTVHWETGEEALERAEDTYECPQEGGEPWLS